MNYLLENITEEQLSKIEKTYSRGKVLAWLRKERHEKCLVKCIQTV